MADTRNPASKIRDYRLFELESIAGSASKNLQKYLHGCRVDIELLLEKEHDLRVESFSNLRRDYLIYAFTVINSKYIFVDADLLDDEGLEKKLRFTIAEEFAHVLIHGSVYATCKDVEERIARDSELDDSVKNRIESNARALAGMLLMPKHLVEAKVKEILESKLVSLDVEIEVIMDQLANVLKGDFDVNLNPA